MNAKASPQKAYVKEYEPSKRPEPVRATKPMQTE